MRAHHLSFRQLTLTLRMLCMVGILMVTGCQGQPVPDTQVSTVNSTQSPPAQVSKAEITFIAHLPEKLADGQSLYLELLDEVTGLAMNPARAKMATKDQLNFGVKAPFPMGSVLKYRYVRDNDPIGVEYNSLNQQVRYRLYFVDGPGQVNDTVTGWKASPPGKELGRIRGQVANQSNKSPVVNALITAGGLQAFTASDGSFLLEGLPPGTHNMVVYSLDGAFRPFQQGAVVGPDSTTPALMMLSPNKLVNVTFHVHPPEENIQDAPIRLIGNLITLGNTFADLKGGLSTLASRAPQLSALGDGTYAIKLKLPVGLDLRYKYSLGDGFWNAEHSGNGDMRVRQVIIPNQDTTFEDNIDTWKTSGFAPITFTVTVPEDTPSNNVISIQFNPFGWTGSIPMWPAGKNRWSYTLYSPLDAFKTASYRFCRNDQCGTADAEETAGASAKGISFSPKDTEQYLGSNVTAWAWLAPSGQPVTVPAEDIKPPSTAFQAGVEMMTGYQPSWRPYMVWGFQNIKDIGSNRVMLTPTWHVTRQNPPVLELVAGQDPMWFDMTQMVSQARQKGLVVTIHPVLMYSENPDIWWQAGARDSGWWQTWFASYRAFILYHADMAAQMGAKSLVVGDASIITALPGGLLADGSPAQVPGNVDQQWSQLITEIRAHFTGKIYWMLPDSGSLPAVPDFLKSVDGLYIQVSAPLNQVNPPTQADLQASFSTLIDGDIFKAHEKTSLPILLGLQYPSVSGADGGCSTENKTCLSALALNQPDLQNLQGGLALNEQADIYSAALSVITQRAWINGFFASGYNPAVELRDTSLSIRGKPASDILWYWFPRLTGIK